MSVGRTELPGQTGASSSSDDIDRMIRDRVARELGSATPDTAAQEALIRQQQDAAIGAGAVNARARAGRGGFQASGALMGIEGDIERQARQAATEQILGVQRDARDEQFGRQGSVIDDEIALRDSASNDFVNQRLLDLLGMTGDEGTSTTDATDGNPFTNSNSESPAGATSREGYSADSAIPVDNLPAGAAPIRAGSNIYVVVKDGRSTFYTLRS